MKKLLFISVIFLSIAAVAFTGFLPYLNSVADIDYPNEGDEPDLPGFLKGKIDKEEIMLQRAEYTGLKRGLDKDKPVDPQLRPAAVANMESQQNRVAAMPESAEKNSLTAVWTPIGPAPIPNGQTVGTSTPVSGRTTAIAVHPTNPNIVYVGTAQGGLYRSTNGGTNWTPMLDNALSLAIGAVAIAPSQPDTIYVGTGEGNFSADSFFGVGIYRIDNASTASPVITGPLNKDASNADIFTGRSISRIVVHPTNPATIFASTTSGLGGIGGFNTQGVSFPNRGVYRSTNATSANPTFTQIGPLPSPNNNFSVHDIALDPLNPNLLAANLNANGGGLYVSTNALGASPTFTNTQTFTGSGGEVNAEFAISHSAGDANPIIYAATGNLGGRVLRSTDGGSTWTQQIDNDFCGGQCFYDIAIASDPTNPAKVYLGGDPSLVFGISTNSGISFTASNNGLHGDSHTIAVAPSLTSTIYFGSDGGIYKSTDSGINWTSLNNSQFSATQFSSIAVHPTNPNFTIGGTQDNGTNFYQPNAVWTRADFGDGGYSLIDQNATDTTNVRMYHTYFNNSGLQGYATVNTTANATDGNWTFRGCTSANSTGNGITCNGTTLFYAPIEQGPGNPNAVYFGTDRLYRSADAGLTNTVVSQNPITTGVPISAIGISPQNDNVRIVGQADGGIFGTINGSTTLVNFDPNNVIPNNFVARTVVDPNNANIIYVTLSGFGVINVWKATIVNNVLTWTAAAGSGSNTIPQVPVSAFLVDSLNSNTLYAGTDIGVYVSTDSGANWLPFGTALPRVAVFDMAITASPRKLRIATHGRGLYEMVLGGAACTYSINPTSQNFGSSGGTGNISVITQDGCPWTATSNAAPPIIDENSRTNIVEENSVFVGPNSPETIFTNSNPITIPELGSAAPYPSAISVSGLTGNIANTAGSVKVTLNNFSHTFPRDIGIVLVGPTGAALLLQDGVTGGQTTANVTYTLSDTGAALLPSNSAITAGTFKPTAYLSGSSFPAPGPGTAYNNPGPAGGNTATFSSTFANTAPNGIWNLYIVDFVSGDSGSISGGWTLDITTQGGAAGFITVTSGQSGIGNGTVNYTVAANATGAARTGTITVAGQTFTVNQSNQSTRKNFDFDGDGKADISVFRPSNGVWYLLNSNTGFTSTQFGVSVDKLAPADFDGDGKTDIAVYRSGIWYILRSTLGFTSIQFGISEDIPQPSDFDGDGKAEVAVYRPSNGTWYIFNLANNQFTGYQFGTSEDKPVVGDYDGDNRADYAVFRPSSGIWYYQQSTAGFGAIQFGISTDKPVPADYDGDGKTDVAVYRPSNGIWYYQRSRDGFGAIQFGTDTDKPSPADYDGDGRADVAVFRPSNGIWYLQRSTLGFTGIQFGIAEDKPAPNAFVPQ